MDNRRALRGRYKAYLGGHAPGHLREAFLDYLERYIDGEHPTTILVGWDEVPVSPSWLLGQLWNCSDILPGMAWSAFEDYCLVHWQDPPRRRTYGAVARWLKRDLGAEIARQ